MKDLVDATINYQDKVYDHSTNESRKFYMFGGGVGNEEWGVRSGGEEWEVRKSEERGVRSEG